MSSVLTAYPSSSSLQIGDVGDVDTFAWDDADDDEDGVCGGVVWMVSAGCCLRFLAVLVLLVLFELDLLFLLSVVVLVLA